jgi:PAS domain S-box-containing protein
MEDKESSSERKFAILRQHAEDLISRQAQDGGSGLPVDIRSLVHELEVRQIELEMQNEELVRAQEELENSYNRYIDLYDFAPVGYLTVNVKGIILEANLSAANLLGVERKKLIRDRLANFVVKEDQDAFYFLHKKLFASPIQMACEIRLKRGGNPFYALLEGITTQGNGAESSCRLTINDISRQKAAEQALELAVLEERQRLARDLHDSVNQSLFSAGLIAEVLPRLWERDQNEARRSLEDLRCLTRGAQAEMRALLAELRPTTLTDTELGDLLRTLGTAFTARTNVPVSETVSGGGSLPAETQVALYRICQEALNNIAKHAKAHQVEIDLCHAPRGVELYIRDNGRGFVTSEVVTSDHYGLGMMRERAEAVGAKLTVTSQPGKGTEIAIRWGEQED